LRFVYVLAVRIVPALGLWRRGDDHKAIEILLLRHQVAVLQRQLAAAGRRPRPDWADRAIMALLVVLVPKARRAGLRLFVTPDTILRWHRDLLRRRWAKKSRPENGRPATHWNIKTLVLRLARQNPAWGYRRIDGELAGLGIAIAASTVWEILKAAGVDPAPRRSSVTWASFLRSQAEGIVACDFFTADPLNGTKVYVLAVREHATRRIRILGSTLHPTGEWTTQVARNMVMDLDDAAVTVKFLIRDRGSNFIAAFDAILADAGIRTVLCNVRTPRMNAIMERWIGSIRRELLNRTLIWNHEHLVRILHACELHHNSHRPHMSLSGAVPLKPLPPNVTDLTPYVSDGPAARAAPSTNTDQPPDHHG
jgi:putative transposase